MSKKRVITLGLCLALTLSTFAVGCGSSSGNSSSSAKSSKTLKLNVMQYDRGNFQNGNTVDNNPIANWIKAQVKAKCNIDVTYTAVPRSTADDKLNAMMAGGNAPDIVFTYSQPQAANYAKNGGVIDLDPYLKKYGQTILKQYGKDALQYGVFYGKQYSLAAKSSEKGARHVSFIRKDWVDKLGAQLPTKKEDLYALLKRFKDEDPGNVGKNNVIPWAMAASNKTDNYYENAVLSYATKLNEKDMYIYDGYLKQVRPGTQDGYKKLNELYNEGIINKDFPLDINEKQYVQDITTGKVGFFTADYSTPYDSGWLDTLKKNVPTAQFVPVAVFENADGEYYANTDDPFGMNIMIPKANEKNAEAAMRYLNWMADPNTFLTIRFGANDGKYMKKDSKGIPSFTMSQDDLTKAGIINMNDYSFIYKTVDLGSDEKNTEMAAQSYPNYSDLIKQITKVKNAKGCYVQPRFSIPPEADTKYGSNLKSMMKSFSIKVISCKQADFDSTWKSEFQKLEEAGLKDSYTNRAETYEKIKSGK